MKLAAACALALIACGPNERGATGGDDTAGTDADPGTGTPRQCNKMDLVFVVDDSKSMEQEQTNLATNFPMFADVLSNYVTPDGEHIDYRIAVTTTGKDLMYQVTQPPLPTIPQNEKGDNGAFRRNCNLTKYYLEPTDANMKQVLACRANVGISGPSFEMPLMMTKWALGDRVADGKNAGFLREDALLGIVMLTDEDDLSTTANNFTISATAQPTPNFEPQDLISFLDTLKGHRSRWAAGVIAGMTDCTSSFGEAAKATRLQDFVMKANGQSPQATFTSICDGNLTQSLQKIVETFQTACSNVVY